MEPVYSVFDEMEQYKPLNYASTGQHFANFLIDIIALYIVESIINALVLATAQTAGSDFFNFMFLKDFESMMLQTLYQIPQGILLYTLMETLFKGKSFGKLVTGTKAVKADGTPLTLKHALIRSLCRYIPFEPLSVFSSNGFWHDRLSKTAVIRTR